MGRIDVSNLPPLCTRQVKFNEFTHSKCSGYMLMNHWPGTAISITSQLKCPSKRLYFLKVLKRSGLPNHTLKHFCTAAIRPILEYCSVVWGHNLSKKHSSQLESIQKRAIRIIYQETRHMPYHSLLYYSNITSFEDRRSRQAKSFFTSILDQSSCLHHLLRQQCDDVVTTKFHLPFKFPVPFVRKIKFQPFLNYRLRRYQRCFCELFFKFFTVWILSVYCNVAVC